MNTAQLRHAVNLALVLDDSAATGKFVCNLLGTLNIPARPFKNPIRFLAEVQSSEPNLLVLDVTLERFDAIDVIRQLETLSFKGKVLLMSGCEDGGAAGNRAHRPLSRLSDVTALAETIRSGGTECARARATACT